MYKDKESQREYQKEWYQKKKEQKNKLLDEVFGIGCFFCGLDTQLIHRKDCGEHLKFSQLSLTALKKELEHKEDYAKTCRICHRAVHWCFEYLNLSWDDIVSRCSRGGFLNRYP